MAYLNAEKLTKNSVEAIKKAQTLSFEYGNPEFKQEHLLYTLLTVEDSLISNLIKSIM